MRDVTAGRKTRRQLFDSLQNTVDPEAHDETVFARLEMNIGRKHFCGPRNQIVNEADNRSLAAEIGELAHVFIMCRILPNARGRRIGFYCWFLVQPADRPLDVFACCELYGYRLADRDRKRLRQRRSPLGLRLQL